MGMPTTDIRPLFNHVAIQTDDVAGTVDWYRHFLEATVEWELDTFSWLTESRLPGIRKLVEIKAGDVRLHVFDRKAHNRNGPDALGFQFQHVGISIGAPGDLEVLRDRWNELFESGRYTWVREVKPSEIVTDDDGMMSLYVLDPNGLELEFIHTPGVTG